MPRQMIHIPALSADLLEAIKHERAYISLTRGPMKIDTRAATATDPAEMYIYGEIGNPFEGSDAQTFGRFLRGNKGKPINVRINSGGGLAYDGITIHNAILQHDAPVTTIIEGMAGSAASIIAVAGSTVQMFQNATFFIHRAQLQVIGNADVMKEALSWLDKIDQQIIDTYKARTGRPRSIIMKEMVGAGGDGTEFNASEALAGKYIDKIMPLKRKDAAAEADFNPVMMKDDGDRRLRSIARLRDMRIHSRKDVLAMKLGCVVLTDDPSAAKKIPPLPKHGSLYRPVAQGGPMFDVGDMVQVMEDGKPVGKGEVRMSMLGYMYDVMQADGTMMEGCCEGDLMPMGESE